MSERNWYHSLWAVQHSGELDCSIEAVGEETEMVKWRREGTSLEGEKGQAYRQGFNDVVKKMLKKIT